MRLLYITLITIMLAGTVYAGIWQDVETKNTWSREKYGFCPDNSMCLVNQNGDESKNGLLDYYFRTPQLRCINNTQYLLDYYCQQGDWISRTAIVAQTIKKYIETVSPTDYRIFCGTYSEVLNYFNYQVLNTPEGTKSVDAYFSRGCLNNEIRVPCVNNICGFEFGSYRGFAVSLNTPINQSSSFLDMIQVPRNACVRTTTNFQKCTSTPAYYNGKLNALIYISPVPTTDIITTSMDIGSYLVPTMDQTVNKYVVENLHAQETLPQNRFNYGFLTNTTYKPYGTFQNIYLAKKNGAQIFGFMEKNFSTQLIDYIGLSYQGTNMGQDPCQNIFKKTDPDTACASPPASNFIVAAKKLPGEGITQLWRDVTAKLRP